MKRTPLKSYTPLKRDKKLNPVSRKKLCRAKVVVDGVIIYSDGRERCDSSRDGREEYKQRTFLMAIRQDLRCALCGLPLAGDITFDHQNGRNAMFVDERIVLPNGKWQNAAVHGVCNCERGSKRTPYLAEVQLG